MSAAAPASVRVELGDRSYRIHVETGWLDRAGHALSGFARDGRLTIVSDETVWALHGVRLAGALAAAGVEAVPLLVPPGEESKSWPVLERLVDRLVEIRLERRDHLIAFGGGMVGDLAGFAASIVKRGCGFVQVPTTLLAQVDSSVGGKTAINIEAGKNLVGAFHQPAAVFIDPATLDTLPPRQLRAGYAEIVKYGLVGDAAFFGWCEANGAALIAGDGALRRHAILTSLSAKAAIVGEDECETGDRRALLNLGHTFGHALEAEAGFSDRLLHGEAVALGTVLAFEYSVRRGLCDRADADRVSAHFAAVGLPTRLGEVALDGDAEALVGHMARDKKARDGRIPFILAHAIGRAFVDDQVALDDVKRFLAGAAD